MIYLVFGFLLFPFLLLAVIVLDSKMSTVGKMIINLISVFGIVISMFVVLIIFCPETELPFIFYIVFYIIFVCEYLLIFFLNKLFRKYLKKKRIGKIRERPIIRKDK